MDFGCCFFNWGNWGAIESMGGGGGGMLRIVDHTLNSLVGFQ